MTRVVLPGHLRALAGIEDEVELDIAGVVSLRSVLDALEARYPVLAGTIREHATKQRRAFIRYYSCEEDFSFADIDAPLPDSVAAGKEPLLVIGAISGGVI